MAASVAALICVLSTAACSNSDTADQDHGAWGSTIAADIQNLAESSPMSESQTAALADDRISESEVHESFERYRSCLRERGYEVSGIVQDGPFINFGIPDAAVQSGADEECYAAEYGAVDLIWQVVENADYSERASQLGNCLQENDVPLRGSAGGAATVAEMEDALRQAGLTVAECGMGD